DEDCQALVAAQVLKEVPVIPWVYAKDVYGQTLQLLQQNLGEHAKLVEFAYDWRLDLTSHLQRLDSEIDRYRARGDKVSIVAHSMSGLMVSYYLRYGTETVRKPAIQPTHGFTSQNTPENWLGAAKVHKVIMAGTPFEGSVAAFINLVKGAELMMNEDILNTDAYRTFAAIYQLLPTYTDKILDDKLKPLNIDLWSPNVWQQHQWNKLASKAIDPQFLNSANALSQLLHQPIKTPSNKPVKLFHVRGKGQPTLDKIVWHQQQNLFIDNEDSWSDYHQGDFETTLFTDGDASVTWQASELPETLKTHWQVTENVTQAPHRELLLDEQVSKAIAQFILEP
ncbi:MAG: hypothetical protein HRT35_25120, partial [Algicola sp.]|nr:hypothetical protein [Algicola sp.]